MSARPQLEMFGAAEPADPLIGLVVQLQRQCRCGSDLSHVGPGSGPHRASLHCARCGHHNGWLSQEVAKLLSSLRDAVSACEPLAMRLRAPRYLLFAPPCHPVNGSRADRNNASDVSGLTEGVAMKCGAGSTWECTPSVAGGET